MPKPSEIAEVSIGGQVFRSWTSLSVRRDLNYPVSVATLTMPEPSGGALPVSYSAMRAKPGDPLTVKLAGKLILTGRLTHRDVAIDAESLVVTVVGRSNSADIVDSSADPAKINYTGYTLPQVINGALRGFPVRFMPEAGLTGLDKPIPRAVAQYGESVWDFIERQARFRNIAFKDTPDGHLAGVQVKASSPIAGRLVLGQNILRARVGLDDGTLYSALTATGQGSGNDQRYGNPVRSVSATVTNPGAKPWRQYLILAEAPIDADDARERANAAASDAAWNQVDATIQVQGWLNGRGGLWEIGDMVEVEGDVLFPNATHSMKLGIQSVTFGQDSAAGTTTTLELRLPQALTRTGDPGVPDGAQPNILQNPVPNPAKANAPDRKPYPDQVDT